MLELLVTSFPAIIRYYQLRRRGEPITVSNMKTAVFLWFVLAFTLFLMIFYYHPKSYTGIVPFRTISVVAQTGGPVTKILVENHQRVKKGDLLFEIENETQKAAVVEAQAAFESIEASEKKAASTKIVAEAQLAQAQASVDQVKLDLSDAEELFRKKVGPADKVDEMRTALEIARSAVVAALAQLELAKTELTDVLPAARDAAEATLASAKIELAKTTVEAFSAGVVSQLALSVGSPASRLVTAPAMVIIHDRDADELALVVAGFSQVTYEVLHLGMPAEIVCNSNANISMINAVFPARIVSIQPAIAAGQFTPGAALVDADSRVHRGTVTVNFKLEKAEHQALLLDGSGCLVQTYTNNIHGIVGHIITGTGLIKAFLLRIKLWGILMTGVGLTGGGH